MIRVCYTCGERQPIGVSRMARRTIAPAAGDSHEPKERSSERPPGPGRASRRPGSPSRLVSVRPAPPADDPGASSPDICLLRAVRATRPEERIRWAQQGLVLIRDSIDGDMRPLLTRQLYLAHLEKGELARAETVARDLVAMGLLPDIAHHDLSRLLAARGDLEGAIREQRLAARAAPPERKSFHLWGLATLQQFADEPDAALATLEKALRCSVRDRALLKAQAAYVRLEAGLPVRGLDQVLAGLRESKNREGYGQFLLGMLAHHMGDVPRAIVHLRAFLRRNAAADPAKELTLREELLRARRALAQLESD